jgi:hypothetical protein
VRGRVLACDIHFNVDVGKGEEGDEDEQGEEDKCSHCARGCGRVPLLEYCNEHETRSNDHECGIELQPKRKAKVSKNVCA